MEEDVAIGKEVDVVVAGVAALRPGGVVPPEDVSLRIADGEDVLAVGDTQQHEAVVRGAGMRGEQENKGGGGEEGGSHGEEPSGHLSRVEKVAGTLRVPSAPTKASRHTPCAVSGDR